MKLNLGCGRLILEGWVNSDMIPGEGVDVVHDLDVMPWPWPPGSATDILAHDIFEHVTDPLGFMLQCWRILQPGGMLDLKTTHWQGRSGWTDPTHKRWLTEESFDYWVPGTDLNVRYGAEYARGASFGKVLCEKSGDLLVVTLRKLTVDGAQ